MEWGIGVTVGKASYKAVLLALCWHHHDKKDQCNPSIDTIASTTELNRKTVMPALDWLREAGLISFEKGNRRFRNYTLNLSAQSPNGGTIEKRDNSSNLGTKESVAKVPTVGTLEENPIVPNAKSHSPKNALPKSQQLDHNRVGKEDRGIPPIVPHDTKREAANRIIETLNTRAEKKYRLTDTNRKPIIARLNDGFTEQDCIQVITNRVTRWHGTELAQYLRPDTLFRPSKFESYLNDAGETGTGSDQLDYDPNRTTAMLRELFPDDYPEEPDSDQLRLTGGGEWTH